MGMDHNRGRQSVPSGGQFASGGRRVSCALATFGLSRWDAVIPAVELEAIFAEAEETVREVAWHMALEGQRITAETTSRIVRRLVLDALNVNCERSQVIALLGEEQGV